MLRETALVLASLCFAVTEAEAQGPRVSELALLQAAPSSSLVTSAVTLSAAQRRAMSTGGRTALWAGIGAAAGFVLENLTTDEDGLKSAELTGVMAGAATGVVFSLVVIPLLWPSKSAQAAP
jgi:hypothetical protein